MKLDYRGSFPTLVAVAAVVSLVDAGCCSWLCVWPRRSPAVLWLPTPLWGERERARVCVCEQRKDEYTNRQRRTHTDAQQKYILTRCVVYRHKAVYRTLPPTVAASHWEAGAEANKYPSGPTTDNCAQTTGIFIQ